MPQRLRHLTLFQTDRDDKNFIPQQQAGFFKRDLQLLVTITLLLVEAARQAGIDVALCGELAADPLATPLLLGLGLEELSLSARFIDDLKRSIARWSIPEAESMAREALALDTAAAVRRLLSEAAGRK